MRCVGGYVNMSLFAALFAALKKTSEVCGVNHGHIYARTRNFLERYNQRNSHINLLKRLITDGIFVDLLAERATMPRCI